MVETVLGFLEAVAPGEPFVVIGTSYGGYLARGLLHFRQTQILGLLMLVPAIPWPMEERILPARQVFADSAPFQATLQPEEAAIGEIAVVQDLELLQAIRADLFPVSMNANHEFLQRLGQFAFDTSRLAEPFVAPALMVAGRQDSLCGYDGAWRLLDQCPRATFVVLDRAGHFLAHEQRRLFHTLASEWLDRVEEYVLEVVSQP
jgi:pimeloyl-ACP methyl ester carboxylesterase